MRVSIKTTRSASVTGKKDKDTNTMNIKTKNFNKKVKLLSGKEIQKKGTIKMPDLSTASEVTEFLKDSETIAAFAWFGFRAFTRIDAANKISGSGKKDVDLKAGLRNFKTSLEVLTDVMNMPKDLALETLLSKESFAGVKVYLESLENDTNEQNFDYTSAFPVPKLGVEEDEDEDEDETATA